MKKHNILLFLMSLVSFIISFLGIAGVVLAIILSNKLADTQNADELTQVIGMFAFMGVILFFVIAVTTCVITVLLGSLGLICSLKNGKWAMGCLVLGIIGSCNGLLSIVTSIEQEESLMLPIVVLLYFGLYTAGAAIAYIGKNRQNQYFQ